MGIPELSHRRVAAAVGLLCLLAYLPYLRLPLISDDYLQIGLARIYGSWAGERQLFSDALYRCRATSLWLTWLVDRLFGPNAFAINLLCLAIHFINCLLVYAMGVWSRIGWRVAAAAACFFAIYEGHQEAIAWFAALPELLVFTFGLLTLLFWVRWLQQGQAAWLAGVVLAYVLALLSKESAVVTPALMAAYALARREPWRRWAPVLAGLALLTAFYALSIFQAKQHHLHFNDGTFNLHAPFWHTLLISTLRMFWFWGLLALIAGLWSRSRDFRAVALVAAVWIPLTFLPYSFLTYMPRVPSRHTYWASVGLSLIVGAALVHALPRLTSWKPALASAAFLLLAHNCGYLWTRKLDQYWERARSTEELIQYARRTPGPVEVRCFPYGEDIVYYSLEIDAGRRREDIRFVPGSAGPGYCFQEQRR